jgi:proteasome lid subunit RPN8/RPN11
MPYSNLALDADRENGPAARSFAADAHDCIMVRIRRSYRIQVCGTKMRPMASSPRILNRLTDRHRPDTEAMQKPLSQFIIAPRAQASRRCETQAPLGGKPLSFATVSVP